MAFQLKYNIDWWNERAGITGITGEMEPGSIIEIPGTYIESGTTFTIVGISGDIFSNNPNIAEVHISTDIYNDFHISQVFNNCENLTKVYLGKGMVYDSFNNCAKLAEVDLGQIHTLGGRFFTNCNIREVSIPASVSSLGYGDFDYGPFSGNANLAKISIGAELGVDHKFCWLSDVAKSGYPGLVELEFLDGVSEVGQFAYLPIKKVTFSETVTKITSSAFERCSELIEVVLPNSLTYLGSSVFSECSKLRSVTLPSTQPTSLGSSIFRRTGIYKINIPANWTSVPTDMFYGCASLVSVTLSENLTSISNGAFASCNNLYEIYNLSTLELTLGSTGNGWVAYYAKVIYTDPNIPSGLTITDKEDVIFTFGDEVKLLNYKQGVSHYEVPSGVTHIVSYVGKADLDITSVSLSDSVKELGYDCWRTCKNLNTLHIGAACTKLSNSFLESSDLVNITVSAANTTYTVIGNVLCKKRPDDSYSIEIGNSRVEFTAGINYYSINWYAFMGNTHLDAIALPSGLKSIGSDAFRDCINLKSIYIPNSVTSISSSCFQNCSSLEAISFPDSLTTIDSLICAYCTSLTTVHLPANLNNISNRAFEGCTALANINIANTLITSIGRDVFNSCSSLSAIGLPNTVQSLGSYCFYNCSSLNKITIPPLVTDIPDYAFQACSSLTEVSFNDAITNIGKYAFHECNLKNIIIPDSVLSLGDSAFAYNDNRQYISISDKITTYKNVFNSDNLNLDLVVNIRTPDINTFLSNLASVQSSNGGLFGNKPWSLQINGQEQASLYINTTNPLNFSTGIFSYCKSVKYINLTGSVSFGSSNSMFKAMPNLLKVDISEGVSEIGTSTFAYCNRLRELSLPTSLRTIKSSAFSYCESLTSVKIPEGVETIGNYAFQGCTSLCQVVLPSTLTAIGSESIGGSYLYNYDRVPHEIYNLSSIDLGTTMLSHCPLKHTQITEDSGLDFRLDGLITYDNPDTLEKTLIAVSTLGEKLTIPADINAFSGFSLYACPNIKEIIIESTAALKGGNLSGLNKLEKLTLRTNIFGSGQGTNLLANVFGSHSNTVLSDADEYDSFNFKAGTYYTPKTLKSITLNLDSVVSDTCYGLSRIVSLDVSKCNSIASDALTGCSGLESVKIKADLLDTLISAKNSIKELDLSGETLTSTIFNDSTSLETVNLSNTIKNIGNNIFVNCQNIKNIIFTGQADELRAAIAGHTWRPSKPESKVYTKGIIHIPLYISREEM